MKKVKIGTAGVDSGQLMVSDPCYVKDFISNEVDFDNKKNDNSYSYNGACHQTLNNETQGGEIRLVPPKTLYGHWRWELPCLCLSLSRD